MIQTTTQKKLLSGLLQARHAARVLARVGRIGRDQIATYERKRDTAKACGDADAARFFDECRAEHRQLMLERRFHEVAIGRDFMQLSREINEHLPREAWLEALSVNRAEWETDDMREHGDSPLNVVFTLRLECSATKDEGSESRPLAWCCQMALMNAMKTSDKMDRAIHEAGNEFFGGAFGEYRERSPLERMGIPASMIQGGQA